MPLGLTTHLEIFFESSSKRRVYSKFSGRECNSGLNGLKVGIVEIISITTNFKFVKYFTENCGSYLYNYARFCEIFH